MTGNHLDSAEGLQERVHELEVELQRRKDSQQGCDRRFLSLAEAAPVMMWMASAEARCTYCNRTCLQFSGRALEQELGQGWLEGVHPEDRPLCLGAFAKSFAGGQPLRMQFRLQRADGAYSWVESFGVPYFGEDGACAGYLGCAAEVPGRRPPGLSPDEDAVRMVFALTERERQVLALIAEGKSTKAAALALGISYKTADSHRSRILEKLGVHETASMVRCAIRAGLIEA